MAIANTIQGKPPVPALDPIRVLVVDDSFVIRGLVSRALASDSSIIVVATAGNGKAAIEEMKKREIDVVVLDIEMPVMDGMTALPQLIALQPGVQVVMASTLTLNGASISMKALSLGAADYVPKPTTTSEIYSAENFRRDLIAKVKTWGLHAKRRRIALKKRGAAPAVPGPAPKQTLHAGSEIVLRQIPANFRPDCLAIGSSTGGPQALFKIFQMMGRMAPVPIFVTQHMPATFTTILADHLAQASGMPAAEAKDGEPVVQGRIYVAPGDYHMVVQVEGGRKIVRIEKSPPENYCRPAVDPMLRSIARAYGGRALVVILTGMGHDGREGAQKLVDAGGVVVAQDEPTSVVWGMPGAVATSKLCSAVLPLSDIAPFVRKTVLRTAA